MKNMKVKFRMDVKNPNRRSSYTKITDIKSFNNENFQTWLSKNFENVINENLSSFTDDTTVELEYVDLDNKNSYKFVIDFKNDIYEFYMNGEKVESDEFSNIIRDLLAMMDPDPIMDPDSVKEDSNNTKNDDDLLCKYINTSNAVTDNINDVNKSCDTNNHKHENTINTEQESPSLRDIVMSSFDELYNDKDALIEEIKDYILYKVMDNDYMFVSQLNPLTECNMLTDKPIAIVIDVSPLNLGNVTVDFNDKIREYLHTEGFSDIMFSTAFNNLACIF